MMFTYSKLPRAGELYLLLNCSQSKAAQGELPFIDWLRYGMSSDVCTCAKFLLARGLFCTKTKKLDRLGFGDQRF